MEERRFSAAFGIVYDAALAASANEIMDQQKPRLAKLHSALMANLFVEAGWTIRNEFRVQPDDEPYEYILEWLREGDPVRPKPPKESLHATDSGN